MKVFTLTPEQIQKAQDLALNIKNSKPYTKFWNKDNITVGILGEMAYGMMTGESINTEIFTDKGDGGTDFHGEVDVKTVTYAGPDPELKMGRIPVNPKAKKLVLAVCDYAKDPSTVKLIGEISIENFTKKCRQRTYGDKSWYAVSKENLDLIYE